MRELCGLGLRFPNCERRGLPSLLRLSLSVLATYLGRSLEFGELLWGGFMFEQLVLIEW